MARSAHAQNLVTNGGFEQGDFSGWTTNFAPNGTQVVTDEATLGFPPDEGTYYAALGPVGATGSISEVLATTPGHLYRVSFSLANGGFSPFDPSTTDSFIANFGGADLLTILDEDFFFYRPYSFDVTTPSGSTPLTFTFRHDPPFFFLDTVSVIAIPEPRTWMLLVAGMAVTGAAMRRCRARVLQPA